MNKELFAIILVSVFLLSVISFVSAEETSDSEDSTSHSISVKIEWNDTGKTDLRPDSITITILKDGEIVGTKILNESNSWSTTFNVAEDGNFSVKEVTNLSSYSVSINDSSENEIIITNTPKDNASGEPQEDNSTENTNTLAAIVIEETTSEDTNSSSNGTDPKNVTDNNSTNNTTNATVNNTTNNNTANITANNTTNNNTANITANNTTDNNNTTQNITKPVPEKEDQNPIGLMKVGIPIIILLVAIFVAVILKR